MHKQVFRCKQKLSYHYHFEESGTDLENQQISQSPQTKQNIQAII